MNPLSTLNKSLIAICVTLAVIAGFQSFRLVIEQRDHAKTIANNEKEWSVQYKTAANAAIDNAKNYAIQTETLQKEANNAKKQRDKATADALANANAGKLLREKLALARAFTDKSESATTHNGSSAARPSIDLFDYVQRRLDEATDTIAAYADSARIAGRACESSYDALSL